MSTKILRLICYFYRLCCLRDCTGNDVNVVIIIYDDARRLHAMLFRYRNGTSFSVFVVRHLALVAAVCIVRAFLGFITNCNASEGECAVFICGQWIASHSFVEKQSVKRDDSRIEKLVKRRFQPRASLLWSS